MHNSLERNIENGGIIMQPKKEIKCNIGEDYFGFNRLYIKIEDIPDDILEEILKTLSWESADCADCGRPARCFVLNLTKNNFMLDKEHQRTVWIDGYFYCGTCAVG